MPPLAGRPGSAHYRASLSDRVRTQGAPHRRTRFWILALALSSPSLAHAGASVWTSGGPYGGSIHALAIDPTTPSTLYAGTYGAGVLKSVDSGGTWVPANTGLPNPPDLYVNALAIDPTTPSTIYAGASGYGVFKSVDSGVTWAAVNTGLTSGNVSTLAIDPTTPSTIYAGTFPTFFHGQPPIGGGVFKSTDSGATWAATNTGLTNLIVTALAINPTTPAILYAATSGGGVFKSTNSAATWAASNEGLTNLYVSALAINPTSPTILYAGTTGGVFKSTDSGSTWAGANAGLMNLIVSTLAIDPTTPSTLYAGTAIESLSGTPGGVFKSTNSGGTWAAADTGLPKSSVSTLAVNRTTPSTLYAGTGGGVFKSTDSGSTWTGANTGLMNLIVSALAIDPKTPSTLYAGTYNGLVFRSPNSGGTWLAASLTHFDVHALAVDPTTPSTLYAGTDGGGVFKSTNSGGTWAAADTGLPKSSVSTLAVDFATPSRLYAGMSGAGGVFKSTDSGGTWVAANTGLTSWSVNTLAIDRTTPTTLYAGTLDGVFKSTDSGSTWAAANSGLTNAWVTALAIDPASPSTLYAGTGNGGVFKSTNSGTTWADASVGLPRYPGLPDYLIVSGLTINPTTPSTLYVGTQGGGVFKSTDSGATWAAVNRGLRNLNVYSLALDPSGPTTVYAGVVPGSVWQSTPPTAIESDLALTLSDSPDPVTGTTPLTYTIAVTNTGPDEASSLSVSQTLPAGVVFDSAGGSGWTCGESGGVVTCTRPGLAVGAAPLITVQVTPGPAAAVLTSSATVSAANADPNAANNSDNETTAVHQALVWFGTRTKTVLAGSGRFVINGDLTYTVTLTNNGTQVQGDNAGPEFQDVLPPGLAFVSANATPGTATADLANNRVNWDGSLPSGSSVTITINATVSPTTALGTTVANQGMVYYDADGNGTNEAVAPTDDPGQPGTSDPTSFVVVSPPMALYTVPPCRLLDTRDPNGPFGGLPLWANTYRAIPAHRPLRDTVHGPSRLREPDGHPTNRGRQPPSLSGRHATAQRLIDQLHHRPDPREQRGRDPQRSWRPRRLLRSTLGHGRVHPGCERLLRVARRLRGKRAGRGRGLADEGLGQLAAGLASAEAVHRLVVGVELGGVLAHVGEARGALPGLDRGDVHVVAGGEGLGLGPGHGLREVELEPALGQPGVVSQKGHGPMVAVGVDRPVGDDEVGPLLVEDAPRLRRSGRRRPRSRRRSGRPGGPAPSGARRREGPRRCAPPRPRRGSSRGFRPRRASGTSRPPRVPRRCSAGSSLRRCSPGRRGGRPRPGASTGEPRLGPGLAERPKGAERPVAPRPARPPTRR